MERGRRRRLLLHPLPSPAAVGPHSVLPVRPPPSEEQHRGDAGEPSTDRDGGNRDRDPSDDRTDPAVDPVGACGHGRHRSRGSNRRRRHDLHGRACHLGSRRDRDSQNNVNHSREIGLGVHGNRPDARRGVHLGCDLCCAWSVFSHRTIWIGCGSVAPGTADYATNVSLEICLALLVI